MRLTTQYRSLWISDVHLGTRRCKADSLVNFLRSTEAHNLFLVGDIVDGWNLGRAWHWTAAQAEVVEEISDWRRRGTKVTFLPGNHDEENLDVIERMFGRVAIETDVVHRTLEGRSMLVTHGHRFDTGIANGRWMAAMGAYQVLTKFDEWYRTPEDRTCTKRLTEYLKTSVRRAVDRATSADRAEFRRAVLETALKYRVDGIICGHIHQPAQFMIGPIWYNNDGDWVENCTALAEDLNGKLRLIRHQEPTFDSFSADSESRPGEVA